MKLLLDQGLPRGACQLLVRHGHDVLHVSEVGLATASDDDILDWAESNGRVVVTLDADFTRFSLGAVLQDRRQSGYASRDFAPRRWQLFWQESWFSPRAP